MNSIIEQVVDGLREQCGEGVEEVREFRDDVIVLLSRDVLIDAATWLRDNKEIPFPLCEDIFGIDAFTRKQRFEVNYHFFSIEKNVRIHFKVRVEEDDAVVPSLTAVYPAAGWYEREAWDMIGVRFSGHPDHRRAYMPEDYEYHPLRKDFPMMGVPGSIPLPKRG